MSQENVEIVKAFFDAWNAGDMDAVRETYDPEVIMRPVEGWPEPGPFVGREAVMDQWARQREAWDTDTAVPTSEFIEVGGFVLVRFSWRGAGHGPEANIEVTSLTTVRRGRVVYVEFFWNHAEALEAVGL